MAGKWDKYKISQGSEEVSTNISETENTKSTKTKSNWNKYKVSDSTSQKPKLFELENIPITEEKISQRPSMLGELIKDPTTLSRFLKHPVGTSLRTAGGALELAEAIPADIGLALQAGKPGRIPSDIGKTLTGQRPAELGDVFRGVGTPEVLASTFGLLASGAKGMPSELVSGGLVKGASKLTQLPKLVGSFGKPFISKSLSILSGIQEDDIVKAIDNPNFLNKGWLKSERNVVSDMYKNEITPNIQNLQNKVKTIIPEVKNTLEDIKLTLNNQPTRLSSTMKPGELDDVERWIDKLKKPQMTLNETDSIIGEMDLGLQKYYKGRDVGKLEPITKTYELLTLKLRNALKSARDISFPELAPKFERYSQLQNAERIYSNFDKWHPKLLNMALAGTIAGPLGQAFGIPWATVSSLTMGSTVPKLQAGAIRAGSQIAKEVGKSAAVPLLSFKQLTE